MSWPRRPAAPRNLNRRGSFMRGVVFPAVGRAAVGAAAALAAAGSGGSAPSARATGLAAYTPVQQRLISGFAQQALEQRAALAPSARARRQAPSQQRTSQTGCPANRGANVRVNQNCLNLTDPDLQGRGQAQNETSIAQDPNDPRHIVASQNDYRRGDGNCYSSYSTDDGRTWTDSTPPMGFTRGAA